MAQPAWPLVLAGNIGANLTTGFANLDNRLGELTKAVESRPALGEPIEQILNVKISVLVGPVQWHCWTVGPGQSLLEAAILMAPKKCTAIFIQGEPTHHRFGDSQPGPRRMEVGKDRRAGVFFHGEKRRLLRPSAQRHRGNGP